MVFRGLYFLFLGAFFLVSRGAEPSVDRLFPYGGPSAEECAALGNPYSREEFVRVLNGIYADEASCEPWIRAEERGLVAEGRVIPWNSPGKGGKLWRAAAELPPIKDLRKPLEGMRIVIDPGHLGGKWSLREQRDNVIAGRYRVCEGVSTLIVAELLSKRLRALGARVILSRTDSAPVSGLDPEALARALAGRRGVPVDDALRKEADALFLRRVEINARAALLRRLRPDLTICLHFDAGSLEAPEDRLHLILNGSYTKSEVADPDLRQGLMARILGKVHEEELAVSSVVAEVMAGRLGLAPLSYKVPSDSVRAVPGQPMLWYRNLLANCLYSGPVLYLEPFAMNNELTARRMSLGDYDGKKVFSGRRYPSIYRQYADAVAAGVAKYYAERRCR